MAIAVDKQGLKKFVEKWTGRGKEDEDDRSYWIDLFQNVFAQSDVTDRLDFQKKVIGEDGNTKRIDVYIPETNIIIEQKSLGIALDKPQAGHKGMTPYEQAKMYDNGLPRSEKARWIVTSNFEEIWVYDMEKRKPEEDIIKITLSSLDKEYHMLQFLFDPQVEQIRRELKVSQEAGDRIGKVYDALLSLYPGEPTEEEYRSLNLFCVRLVFCYYAEDAELFGKYQFRDYVASFNPKHLRNGLKDLFRILDTKEDERDRTEEPELLAFPYVNGGLFADHNIIIPQIDEKTQKLMAETSDFNWSEISPTIFGAVFESTLNQETRRKGGMHYTSIENIHKVIDPLFLDDLKSEFKSLCESKQPNVKRTKLREFQKKLGTLKFFDPACGSGNFLTETYLSLRQIENNIIEELNQFDREIADEYHNPINVRLSQFYGIEINDFAVSVAKTALWIAENQMMKKTQDLLYGAEKLSFLPLKSYVNIVEGNALRVDWKDIIEPSECSYIMGNPPFVANSGRVSSKESSVKAMMTVNQKEEKYELFGDAGGTLDYVACWYKKASIYMRNTRINAAFVSTNSVCQGEQVAPLWKDMINEGLIINFAHRSFKWESEASIKATVYVVIVGFSYYNWQTKRIFDQNAVSEVKHINAYLIDADDVFVERRSKPICKDALLMHRGSQPTDDGNFIFSEEEYKDFISRYPDADHLFKKFMMGKDFIDRKPRYCLWLVDAHPGEIRKYPPIMNRVAAVADFRRKSSKAGTRKKADTPTLFDENQQPNTNYVAIPEVSSGNRYYVPMDFMSPDIVVGNKIRIAEGAGLYEFGILTSIVHMAWMRATCGYYGPSYQYSINIVYNNFPWPNCSDDVKKSIELAAQSIIDSRNKYGESSLADLYDPLIMPCELRKAHEANDRMVMKAYGFKSDMTEPEIVAELMKMYQKLTEE